METNLQTTRGEVANWNIASKNCYKNEFNVFAQKLHFLSTLRFHQNCVAY